MKHLLLIILFTPFYLNASEIFFLPDHTTDALYTIDTTLKNSQKELLIITAALQSEKIEKRLKKLAISGVKTTLIISNEHAFKASKLLQYRHIDLRTIDGLQSAHKAGEITTTLILSDQKELCLCTAALDEQAMRHDIGFLECTREPQRVKTYLRHAQTLQKRSKSYLK
ncbi:MAG: hypothetical protein U9Q62_09210 [Campylobacterota bacterium]|nr:hypothetical protein [Campylobacterota bacterium]